VVLDAGCYLGMAISSLIGALNVQKIVMVGEMTRFGAPWLEAVQETVLKTSLPRLSQDTRVEIGLLGENAIILGASALLVNNYSLLFSKQSSNGS
jgi:predicted NBD/HSP70 family sugar kinase